MKWYIAKNMRFRSLLVTGPLLLYDWTTTPLRLGHDFPATWPRKSVVQAHKSTLVPRQCPSSPQIRCTFNEFRPSCTDIVQARFGGCLGPLKCFKLRCSKWIYCSKVLVSVTHRSGPLHFAPRCSVHVYAQVHTNIYIYIYGQTIHLQLDEPQLIRNEPN